jgi:hypothetical protein
MIRKYILLMPLIALATLSIQTKAQNSDPLSNLDGIWASVNPPGPHVTFNRVGLGQREASLSIGQASLRVSNGESGSNLKVSGENFECFYFVGFVSAREMTWQLKQGSSVCPQSSHYKKDPP